MCRIGIIRGQSETFYMGRGDPMSKDTATGMNMAYVRTGEATNLTGVECAWERGGDHSQVSDGEPWQVVCDPDSAWSGWDFCAQGGSDNSWSSSGGWRELQGLVLAPPRHTLLLVLISLQSALNFLTWKLPLMNQPNLFTREWFSNLSVHQHPSGILF